MSNGAPPPPQPDNTGEMKALGHAPPRTGLAFRMQQEKQGDAAFCSSAQQGGEQQRPVWLVSLQEACRHVIVANFERYPPAAMGMVDDQEWNLLLEYRHGKTKPKSGQGGLDGTGRMAPALSDKFLAAVEESHPDEKVRESETADLLLWKDCVNYSFRKGGLTRPQILEFPWPVLVQKIQAASAVLVSGSSGDDHQDWDTSMALLERTPMNVNLLVASGAGKAIKKAIKKQQKQQQQQQQQQAEDDGGSSPSSIQRMERLLACWKDLASREGVPTQDQQHQPPPAKKKRPPGAAAAAAASSSPSSPAAMAAAEDEKKDWERAEASHNWRQLFAALKQREEDRRSAQGQRMRQIRKNLNTDRPKVVKVRPAKAQHQRILNKNDFGGGAQHSHSNPKLAKLKREAQVVSGRVNRGEVANNAAISRLAHASQSSSAASNSMFARAVAGAAGSKNNKGGGKRRIQGRTMLTMPGKSGGGAAARGGRFQHK